MRANSKPGVSLFWTAVVIAGLCWVLVKYNSRLTDTVLTWFDTFMRR
jgi:hypothetical protein